MFIKAIFFLTHMGEDEEYKEEESMEKTSFNEFADETDSEDVTPKSEKTEEKTLKQAVKKLYKMEEQPEKPKRSFKESIIHFYDTKYKQMLFVTFGILILAMFLIGMQIAQTGDFVKKDISLSGGITLTIFHETELDIKDLEQYINAKFPGKDISVRSLTQLGENIGVIIEGTDFDSEEVVSALKEKIGDITKDDYSVSMMGSSLGSTFFRETLKSIFVSFMFMGLVVFLYFGENLKVKLISFALTSAIGILIFSGTTNLIKDTAAYIIGAVLLAIYYRNSRPSFMMVLNVFADLVVTLAIVNLIGMKISTAGVASFLMIIGYCVETNILLTTKLIKKKEGALIDRLIGAFNTGFIMTATASGAVIVALLTTQSDVIKEIMTILLIGLIVDMVYTWIQNVGLLRIYLDKTGAR